MPESTNQFTNPFEPIIFSDTKILILGTFPSLKSFENNFYYAHPRNLFWKLLSASFGKKTPQDTQEKILLLRESKIGLWDIIEKCERQNSLDSNLKNIQPCNIPAILEKNSSIDMILFTSRTAEKIYYKYFDHLNVQTYLLPSPSSAYAVLSYEQKLQKYIQILKLSCSKTTILN